MKNEKMKEKKESNLKKKINELKKTNKGKAILRLIKWGIFFFILFIFLAVASLMSPQSKESQKPHNNIKEPTDDNETIDKDNWNEETLTIETISKYQEYLSNTYDYKCEISINKEKYIYSGTKTKSENKGFKESSSGIIKYLIDSTGSYEETTTEKKIINNLYEGLEENYLNPIYILNLIKSLEIIRDRECDCVYPVYKANDAKNIYRISVLNKQITNISITALDFSYLYTLSFENVK